jgi:hypothetical protein
MGFIYSSIISSINQLQYMLKQREYPKKSSQMLERDLHKLEILSCTYKKVYTKGNYQLVFPQKCFKFNQISDSDTFSDV